MKKLSTIIAPAVLALSVAAPAAASNVSYPASICRSTSSSAVSSWSAYFNTSLSSAVSIDCPIPFDYVENRTVLVNPVVRGVGVKCTAYSLYWEDTGLYLVSNGSLTSTTETPFPMQLQLNTKVGTKETAAFMTCRIPASVSTSNYRGVLHYSVDQSY